MAKKKWFLGMLVMVALILVAAGCSKAAKSAPRDGTYTFNPRPQAVQAGQPVAAYLDKVTVSGGYTTFYFTSVPSGKGYFHDIPGYWGEGSSKGTVVLQNLNNKAMSYNDVDADVLYNETGQYSAFDSIAGYRFSLSDQSQRPPIIFNEIVLRKPDKADSSMEKFIYATPGLDPTDFTEMDAASFAELMTNTKWGSVKGYYISEVVFVSQSGTNLTFQAFGASKTMQTGSAPTGLSAGQNVRIYYRVDYSMSSPNSMGMSQGREGWGVYAIERSAGAE